MLTWLESLNCEALQHHGCHHCTPLWESPSVDKHNKHSGNFSREETCWHLKQSQTPSRLCGTLITTSQNVMPWNRIRERLVWIGYNYKSFQRKQLIFFKACQRHLIKQLLHVLTHPYSVLEGRLCGRQQEDSHEVFPLGMSWAPCEWKLVPWIPFQWGSSLADCVYY